MVVREGMKVISIRKSGLRGPKMRKEMRKGNETENIAKRNRKYRKKEVKRREEGICLGRGEGEGGNRDGGGG